LQLSKSYTALTLAKWKPEEQRGQPTVPRSHRKWQCCDLEQAYCPRISGLRNCTLHPPNELITNKFMKKLREGDGVWPMGEAAALHRSSGKAL
jgi:hypothetical protein